MFIHLLSLVYLVFLFFLSCIYFFFFFFSSRRRHTRSLCDWSSDVCSSDLKVQTVEKQTDDIPDTGQTILVSTAENKLYVRQGGQTIFQAVCSTGKGSTLAIDGHTWVFDTPIGKLRVVAKEENPEWVPPDWHYIEEARKSGMRVVHLQPGQSIDARTGDPASGRSEGVWSWFSGGSGPVL